MCEWECKFGLLFSEKAGKSSGKFYRFKFQTSVCVWCNKPVIGNNTGNGILHYSNTISLVSFRWHFFPLFRRISCQLMWRINCSNCLLWTITTFDFLFFFQKQANSVKHSCHKELAIRLADWLISSSHLSPSKFLSGKSLRTEKNNNGKKLAKDAVIRKWNKTVIFNFFFCRPADLEKRANWFALHISQGTKRKKKNI